MTDAEIIQRAKETFVLDTPTERLARELIGVAERAAKKAALWDKEKELADSAYPARQTGPYQYVVATKPRPPR